MVISVITGERVETRFIEASTAEINALKGWRFDWKKERKTHEVFKLTAAPNYDSPIGLMSIRPADGFLFISLIERAGYRLGVKEFDGIVQCLMAHACTISYRLGNMGAIAFDAKTQLIPYYEKT